MSFPSVEELLPHRAPFLLVDAIAELEAGHRAVCTHAVREDAFWVPGHFPGHAVMPGVLIAEALAQTAAVAALAGEAGAQGHAVYLVGYDRLRFRKPVRPGDVLELEATLESERRGIVTFAAEARVDGQRVANGTLMAALAPREA
ncbi:MAG: beta-hydroxyacyl-ACP dehydratase [Deltaproteobacteria bacterium]|nr:MAG: beta-hydroxyacyl-ACP dehydratase [Deltaproteobacteria bacterium]